MTNDNNKRNVILYIVYFLSIFLIFRFLFQPLSPIFFEYIQTLFEIEIIIILHN